MNARWMIWSLTAVSLIALASGGSARLEAQQNSTAHVMDHVSGPLPKAVREATEQFLLAVHCESDNPDYHFDLGNVEFVFRRDLTAAWKIDSAELLQRALFQFREASRLASTDREYARAYAETFYGMPNPDWKEAQVAWQHYLELSTNRNFAYLQLARVSLKQRKRALRQQQHAQQEQRSSSVSPAVLTGSANETTS